MPPVDNGGYLAVATAHDRVVAGGVVYAKVTWRAEREVNGVQNIALQLHSGDTQLSEFVLAANKYTWVPDTYTILVRFVVPWDVDPRTQRFCNLTARIKRGIGYKHVTASTTVELAGALHAVYPVESSIDHWLTGTAAETITENLEQERLVKEYWENGKRAMQRQVESANEVYGPIPFEPQTEVPLRIELSFHRCVAGGVIHGQLIWNLKERAQEVQGVSISLFQKRQLDASCKPTEIVGPHVETEGIPAQYDPATYLFLFTISVPLGIPRSRLPAHYYIIAKLLRPKSFGGDIAAGIPIEVIETLHTRLLANTHIFPVRRVQSDQQLAQWEFERLKRMSAKREAPSAVLLAQYQQQQLLVQPVVAEEIYENQRKVPLGKYTSQNLRGSDPAPWTDAAGNPVDPKDYPLPEGPWHWTGEWHVDVSVSRQSGWMYAANWPHGVFMLAPTSHWNEIPRASHYVRRRRWTRVRVNKELFSALQQIQSIHSASQEFVLSEMQTRLQIDQEDSERRKQEYERELAAMNSEVDQFLRAGRTLMFKQLADALGMSNITSSMAVVDHEELAQRASQTRASLRALRASLSRRFTGNPAALPEEDEKEEEEEEEEPLAWECTVCADHRKDCVLLPCAHFALCTECAANLEICPFCRTEICARMKVYHV
eukprot:TRINITY_DN7622_c0_g1_i1.p1 TRINITY_DN7622_c0_g1~~TRINITY_DN7622_c0_g1_i1.p1  ORF type:complete len:658 (+),score=111.10 TRINITY_DN7622_c0_g1_i1:44-2017(+)